MFPWILLLVTLAPRARAGERICVTGLAARSASESCRASWSTGDGQRLCVPRELWGKWLARPGGRCGEWEGEWRLRAPLRNEASPGPKRFTRELLASGFVPSESGFDAGIGAIERARERISGWLAPQDRTGALRKLLLDESSRSPELEALWLFGLGHFLAASGIHLYAASRAWESASLAGVELALGSARASSPFWIAAARLSGGIAWLAAWALAGLRIGMLRPILVLGAKAVARACGAKWRPFSPIAVALAAELGIAMYRGDFSPGRWVSALAAGGAILATGARAGVLWRFESALGTWSPFALAQALFQGTVSLAAPLLGWVLVLAVATLCYPACLAALVLHAAGLEEAARASVGFASWICDVPIESLLRAAFALPALFVVSRGGALAGMVGACAVVGLRGSRLARRILLVVALLLVFRMMPGPDRPGRVVQLDVGQGDSALVLARGSAGLIDAGSGSALSGSAWVRLLSERGRDRIDWIGLTHLDEDHSGGTRTLAAWARVRCVATSAEELASDRGMELRAALGKLGVPLVPWESGCVPFRALGPGGARARVAKGNENMSAIAVPLGARGTFLSMGDASEEQELAFLRRLGPVRAPVILKVSHHGSRTSTAIGMLQALRPARAWISVGLGNRYGHPSEEAIRRIRDSGVEPERTDRDGRLDSEERPRSEPLEEKTAAVDHEHVAGDP